MPSQRPIGRHQELSRQRPISCDFCKSRKLRCSRESPCSNCASRGIPCQLPVPQRRSATSEFVPGAKLEKAHEEIFERLRRLEEVVARQVQGNFNDSGSLGATLTSTPSARSTSSGQLDFDPARIPAEIQDLADDAIRVEQECRSPNMIISLPGLAPPTRGLHASDKHQDYSLSDPIMFKISPLEQIDRTCTHVSIPSGEGNSSVSNIRCIWVPPREEMIIIIIKYAAEIAFMHNVTHLPTLEQTVLSLYEDIPLKKSVQLGRLALVCGIVAAITIQWLPEGESDRKLFSSQEAASQQTAYWIKNTLDIADYSRRTGTLSLEHVQALVMVMFVICNLEGYSFQFGTILFSAIIAARDLGLHTIDYEGPHHPARAESLKFLEAEMGRRVWWHLASSDWFLSQGGGQMEGSYLIQPAHIATRKPMDLFDDEITEAGPIVRVPDDPSTVRTYPLLRIRLATLCREYTDRLPLSSCPTASERFDATMDFDASLHKFLRELPPAFRLKYDDMSGIKASSLPRTQPTMVLQRYVININACSAICRIHFPYLTRATVDPAFAYSRDACVQAARRLIWAELELEESQISWAMARSSLFGLMYFAFMASIVLLLDIRLTALAAAKSGQPAPEPTSSHETYEACRMLERAGRRSPVARKAYQLLMQLRNEQDLTPPSWAGDDASTEMGDKQPAAETADPGMPAAVQDPAELGANGDWLLQEQGQDASSALVDGVWQHVESGEGLENLDWKTLLSGLDTSMMGPV